MSSGAVSIPVADASHEDDTMARPLCEDITRKDEIEEARVTCQWGQFTLMDQEEEFNNGAFQSRIKNPMKDKTSNGSIETPVMRREKLRSKKRGRLGLQEKLHAGARRSCIANRTNL